MTELVASIPLKGGGHHGVTVEDLGQLRATFPELDVETELRRLVLWNRANPRRRKTPRGIRRHVTAWLTRAALRAAESFYETSEWQAIRYQALARSRGRCELCGARDELHIDHVEPRSARPDLALTLENLQVLCRDCNLGKSNRDRTDWRELELERI